MIWSQIADRTPGINVDRVAAVTRRALRDKKTRDALARTVAQGRATYARFANDDAKSGLAKLARDAKTQDEVGSLVRSVAQAIDTGLAKRQRRSSWRRIGMTAAIAAGIGAVLARRRRTRTPSLVHQHSDDGMEPLNGAVTEAERSIRI